MAAVTETRTWTLQFPAPAEWLSANKRYKRRPDEAIRAWRQAAALHARAAGLPRGLPVVSVYATLHFTTNHRRDAHNYMSVVKCCIDGLVDYGLIPDDSKKHLRWTAITEGEVLTHRPFGPAGSIDLLIVEESV